MARNGGKFPPSVLIGFLGSGKTTLLRRLLDYCLVCLDDGGLLKQPNAAWAKAG